MVLKFIGENWIPLNLESNTCYPAGMPLTKRLEKKLDYTTTQECCEQYWTGPGSNTLQSSSCPATYYPSPKLSKLDETVMQDTAGEVGSSS